MSPVTPLPKLVFIVLFLIFVFTATSRSQIEADYSVFKKIDPELIDTLTANDQVEFIVFLSEQADLAAVADIPTKTGKGRFVFEQLTEVSQRSQTPITRYLDALAVPYRTFWIANMIWTRGGLSLAQALSSRSDVAYLYSNPRIALDYLTPEVPIHEFERDLAKTIQWNLQLVRAPEVWDMGYKGQGVVIGGQDTGYDWEHPALKSQYRGWDGENATHDYNWHDAIHDAEPNCGADSVEPCDDDGHGTHTLGIMVGDDGGENQIGMAPRAKWIGCRNMRNGIGSPSTYIECYEWFVAPTNLDGNNPDPDAAPHVINNSWSCPIWEGCDDLNVLERVVENVRAAGIVTVHAAGNSGAECGTIDEPAAIYDASYTIGATTNSDTIAAFSSRGPAVIGEETNLKPDVTAPGQIIYSSLPSGSYGYLSGTSMAAPHVAGLIALAISADPDLSGQVDQLEQLISESAVAKTSAQACGGVPADQIPNNVYGFGRIDALNTIYNISKPSIFLPAVLNSLDQGKHSIEQ